MPQQTQMEIPPEILRILAQRMGQAGGAMGGGGSGMPLPGGVPGAPRPQQPTQSTAAPAYNIRSDPRSNIGSLPPPVQRPNPTQFQGSGPVGALISLLGNWHSNKQKGENTEAANAAQSLMQTIEAAKSTGDWTPAYTILHNNEKLFNKVYKGWLQKNEMQAQEQQKKGKAKPPDPDVQGFEQGVQQFLQKKQQQPQGAPPQGSAPKALGGYQLPGAPAPQQIQQQATSATQQAQRQDPTRGLPGGQLTSGESRQAELSGAGLAQTPKTEAEMAKYQSQMQTAALGVQKAQADAQKAMSELQLKNAEAQTAKEKGVISLDIETKRAAIAQANLDAARARLELIRATGGGKLKEPPIKVKTQLDALDQAQQMLESLEKNVPTWHFGTPPQELRDLQSKLKLAGLSSLASTIPPNAPIWSKTDVKGMLATLREGFQSFSDTYKQAVKENYPAYKADKIVPAIEDDTNDEEGGEVGGAVPEVGDEVDGYTFTGGDPNDQKNWKQSGKKP